MNKKYDMPEFLVQELDIEDVIATSQGLIIGGDEDFGGSTDEGYGELL